MGMCYVYAVVPQHGFISQKNRNYEIIMLLACIDMMCLCVDAMDQHKKQAYTRVGCFFSLYHRCGEGTPQEAPI